MRKNNFYKIKGFTLIELLIAISIIAILSVVLSVNFSRAQKNGRDQRRITDLKAIQSAAEQYYLLKGNYPANKKKPNLEASREQDAAHWKHNRSPLSALS